MKIMFQFVMALLIVTMSVTQVFGMQIQIVADDFPPQNYLDENGKVTGVSTEIVRAVLKELGIEAKINIYPWARAYKIALEQENVLIYTIGRNPKRENLFKWVGHIVDINACLFSLKNRDDITINALDDARKYHIGAVRNDIRTQHLLTLGFDKLFLVSQNEQILKMLLKNRVDLWLDNELTGYYIMKKNGYIPDEKFKIVHKFLTGMGGYMAFSKATSDELVEKFTKALEQVKKDGTYKKIMDRYR